MQTLRYALMLGALLLMSTLPLIEWLPAGTWHDQQRIPLILESLDGTARRGE